MLKLVGVTGGSGGGKSYFAKKLIERIGPNQVNLIHLDNYYIEQSHLSPEEKDRFNWDLPGAIDFLALENDVNSIRSGEPVFGRHYDFETHRPSISTEKLPPKPYVVLEGIFALHSPKVRQNLDLSIFVDASTELRYRRRLERDQKERGRSELDIKRQFTQQVEPAYQKFVAPQKDYADIVLNSEEENPYNFESILELSNSLQNK